jgi:extracellular elastinolytic metalloproteinase
LLPPWGTTYFRKSTFGGLALTQSNPRMADDYLRHRDWEGQNSWLHNGRPVNSSYIFDYEYGEPDGLRPKEYM